MGTSSARRQAWLTHFKPGVRVEALRGNVPTRLKKLRAGDYEAILLAAAGIERLRGAGDLLDSALDGAIIERLDPQVFVPAPAQGALALQCRIDDAGVREILARLDDPKSRAEVTAERDALARAEGGCDTAFGAYCEAGGLGYQLTVMLERAGEVRSVRIQSANSDTLGARAWAELINA